MLRTSEGHPHSSRGHFLNWTLTKQELSKWILSLLLTAAKHRNASPSVRSARGRSAFTELLRGRGRVGVQSLGVESWIQVCEGHQLCVLGI